MNKFQWNVNQNSYVFIQENPFEYVVWKMAAILSRLQCVNSPVILTIPSMRESKRISVKQIWHASQCCQMQCDSHISVSCFIAAALLDSASIWQAGAARPIYCLIQRFQRKCRRHKYNQNVTCKYILLDIALTKCVWKPQLVTHFLIWLEVKPWNIWDHHLSSKSKL